MGENGEDMKVRKMGIGLHEAQQIWHLGMPLAGYRPVIHFTILFYEQHLPRRDYASVLYRLGYLASKGGGMAEWLASPDWDREVVGSYPGFARSDGQ